MYLTMAGQMRLNGQAEHIIPNCWGLCHLRLCPDHYLLVKKEDDRLATQILGAIETLLMQNNLSSAHLNFITPQDRHRLEERGWLIRKGLQFHWHNQNYQNFDSFSDQLSSRKRKNIRKERQSLSDRGIEFQQLTAEAITPAHWDSFYQFYLSTIERKWGGAYLTEDFFHQIGKMMADRILLVLDIRKATKLPPH